MERAMIATQAWELTNDPSYCGRLKMGEFHKLLLRAGYSEEDATVVAKQHGWDRLSAGEVM